VGAHYVVAAIYNLVTAGFDTRDLREGKALLDELGELAPTITTKDPARRGTCRPARWSTGAACFRLRVDDQGVATPFRLGLRLITHAYPLFPLTRRSRYPREALRAPHRGAPVEPLRVV
jgi:hypothetical protein